MVTLCVQHSKSNLNFKIYLCFLSSASRAFLRSSSSRASRLWNRNEDDDDDDDDEGNLLLSHSRFILLHSFSSTARPSRVIWNDFDLDHMIMMIFPCFVSWMDILNFAFFCRKLANAVMGSPRLDSISTAQNQLVADRKKSSTRKLFGRTSCFCFITSGRNSFLLRSHSLQLS